MKHVSRREFNAMLAAGLFGGRIPSPTSFGQPSLGAGSIEDVITRIRQNIGVEWRAETVDTVKAGDPSRDVTGIVTTSNASVGVLRQAAGRGANLIITSEPTFYSRGDTRTPPAGRGGAPPAVGAAATVNASPPPPDPMFAAKNALIDEQRLVVFRLSDHWGARRPDPFVQGLARAFGWASSGSGDEASRYDIPPTTLEELASSVKRALGGQGGIRVIGQRLTPVRRVALLPGTTSITASLAALPMADVVIAGEVREWESAEYARDVVASGQPKGLILVGRILSEDPGMRLLSEWLRALVPDVTIQHISAGDPYWRPGA